jgi:TniQ
MMLLKPLPLPDELDCSLLGAMRRFNAFSTPAEVLDHIAASLGLQDQSRTEVANVELMARCLDMELSRFVREHTLLPLRRSVAVRCKDLPHGAYDNPSLLYKNTLKSLRGGAYFCRDCALEDVAFHGRSYWRRSLQIPGAYWCPRHHTALRHVHRDDAFLESPIQIEGSGEAADAPLATFAKNHSRIQVFLELCSALLDEAKPLVVPDVADSLRKSAVTRGLHVSRYHPPADGAKPLLSDHIRSQFPEPWLAAVCADLPRKSTGDPLPKIDGVLYLVKAATSYVAYALAASVLYANADEALHAITRASRTRQQNHLAPRERMPDDRIMATAYAQCNGSHTATSNDIRRSKEATHTRLNHLGLPAIRRFRREAMLAGLVAFYVKRRSLRDSARTAGIPEDTFEDFIRRCGEPMARAIRSMTKSYSAKAAERIASGTSLAPATRRFGLHPSSLPETVEA